ncbi:tetratricopeptide repeat protein [Streptomyces sp. AM2-3-1]|uniref:tetratricopeptide repeat protein n=1 Tax=Streptomyces sp. AM2-3-1 TaxID=3075824 RepID=UPI0028C4C430|nr:tetratricopeptide repeat protein [Streptomyces sp. AM2-3-1]WNO64005.1 tetratricopeptide repeat protein [Streptomyces sp. AM2-3-1]
MSGGNDAQADGQGRVYQASGDQHIIEHHHHSPEWSGPDSVRHPAVGRAPVALRDRVGEMDRLRAAVEPGIGNCVYVLHGLGGCGKTAVAYTLFQHATSALGRVGLWVNASDPASLRAGMLAVAADRGATDAELTGARSGLRPAADLVWQYLDRSERPWLLVLDNADTPAVLRDGGWLRTSPAGTVIVTTRQAAAHWWPGAELLQFGVLPREDAARVLQDIAPHAGSIDEAAEVADRLGHLPLALTLAGGFLAHQVIDPWTLADYGHRLDNGAGLHRIELIDRGAETHSDPRRLLSRTWQLSLDALTAQGLPEATHLLRLLACLASDPLPLKILAHAELGAGLNQSRVESALRGLLDHSLAELVPGPARCLRVHGILLDSVAQATPHDQRQQLASTAVHVLKSMLPEVPERGAQDPAVITLAPHVIAFLQRVVNWETGLPATEGAVECVLRLVIAVHRSGDYTSALALANEAIEIATPILQAQNVFILRLRQRVGRALFRLGRFEESKTAHQEILEECERTLGSDALDTLETCLRLASPLYNLGRVQESIPLVRRAAQGREETLGKSHPLTLIARKSLLEMAGNPDIAGLPVRDELISTGPALIADCRSAAGEDHPLTLGAELNYALVLVGADRPIEALPHVRKALAGYELTFPPDYPLLINTRHTLGRILNALGQQADAVEQATMVAEGRIRTLGPTHPWTLNAQDLLNQYRNP